MNTPEPLATMPTPKVLLSLFAVERDLDRLAARRHEIMAELATRLAASKGTAQPETPPPSP